MKRVFGINFSSLSQKAIVELVTGAPLKETGPRLVVTTNLDHVVNLTRRADYRAAYGSAWIATADGWPVYLYARLRGVGIPARVTGSDLVQALFDSWNPVCHRLFLIGSSKVVCELLTDRLIAQGFHPSAIAWVVPPLGFESIEGYSNAMAEQVAQHRTTHLLMGIGSPKSEVWVHQQRHRLGDLYAFGFGAGLDFLAGTRRRAPVSMQRTGLEWLWRLAQEPGRLAPRYLVNSWRFLLAVAKDLRSPMSLQAENSSSS
jgi:N-acetylglucosaminyldiphosphoundecaprenol N-acetyl-beta-D-mannosaminyltransferase